MSKFKRAIACLISGTCLSASTLVVPLLPSVNPLLLVASRSALLSVITIPVCLFRRHSSTYTVVEPEDDDKLALLIHLVTGSAFLMCFFYSVRLLSLADATAIASSAPVFANLLSCLVVKRRCGDGSPPAPVVGAAVVASAGILLVTRLDLRSLGVCLALAGTVSRSVFFWRPLRQTDALTLSLFTTAVSTILFTFVQDMTLPPCGAGGAYFLFCGILASAGQYVCLITGSPASPPPQKTEEFLPLLQLSEMLMAFILQSVFLQERAPVLSSCIGATLVALCLVVPSLRKWRRRNDTSGT